MYIPAYGLIFPQVKNYKIRAGVKMKYWLMKTEPRTYSWEDLKNEPEQTTCWEGVRNYQARNMMRDEMKKGDKVFIYHSVIKPMAIMGIAEVVKESYPDYFSRNPESRYFDPKSTQENPRWFMVDVKAIRDINPPVTLEELKKIPELENMMLLRKGSRLSIQPVTKNEFEIILKLRNIKL